MSMTFPYSRLKIVYESSLEYVVMKETSIFSPNTHLMRRKGGESNKLSKCLNVVVACSSSSGAQSPGH